jgi:hypothetical protein
VSVPGWCRAKGARSALGGPQTAAVEMHYARGSLWTAYFPYFGFGPFGNLYAPEVGSVADFGEKRTQNEANLNKPYPHNSIVLLGMAGHFACGKLASFVFYGFVRAGCFRVCSGFVASGGGLCGGWHVAHLCD